MANDDSCNSRVPVTIITGFLGSGKTTLLNHILSATHGKKLAIIENEFGEVGIDDTLLAKNTKMQAEEELIEMMNGCICCTVRQDLVVVLAKLACRIEDGLALDGIIIETTGMADPSPVAQTFFVHKEVLAFARLDGIVTVVDAKHIEQHLDEQKPDGAENEAVEQVAFADHMLLNKTDLVTAADVERIEGRLRAINKFAPIQRCVNSEVAVDSVLSIGGFDLKRTLEMDPDFLDTSGEHQHDSSVTSLSITQPGSVDLVSFNEWVSALLNTKGADLYRMKGVLAIDHADQKLVYHGIHMIFNAKFDEEWSDDEVRENRLVFIGKNLEKEALSEGFRACLATPELQRKKRSALRFAIGDRVECNRGNAWRKGEVVALLYRDESMPPGQVVPFQVRLDNGFFIYVDADSDDLIRKASSIYFRFISFSLFCFLFLRE